MENTLSNQQVKLIQASFNKLMPISDTFVHLFYEHLFEIRPDLRELFTASIDDQGPKLFYMLALLVRGVDRLTNLTPAIQELSKRHLRYGVQAQDYESVGEALL